MLLKLADPIERRFAGPVRRILAVQERDGAIPWFEDGPWDAWNHAECVLALNIAGEREAAWAALEALAARQLPDGGFLSEYGNALPMTADLLRIQRGPSPGVKDTNFAAYVATAAWQCVLLDIPRAGELWPMVRAAIDHVLACQHAEGDISWCAEAHGTAIDDALLTGGASTYASLGHAQRFAEHLGEPAEHWAQAHRRLGEALRHAPHRFARAAATRPDHAMDWYYPVLAGVISGDDARAHLRSEWSRFVDPHLGCHCVDGEPWVTVAESCELAIAAFHAGMGHEASVLLDQVEHRRDAEGAFWMGWQRQLEIDWPAEAPSWTQAAYVLATDAVEGLTAARALFKP